MIERRYFCCPKCNRIDLSEEVIIDCSLMEISHSSCDCGWETVYVSRSLDNAQYLALKINLLSTLENGYKVLIEEIEKLNKNIKHSLRRETHQ